MKRAICKWLMDHRHYDLAVKLWPETVKDITFETCQKAMGMIISDILNDIQKEETRDETLQD